MAQNSEEYEILKDNSPDEDISDENEFYLLETRLSKYQSKETSLEYSNEILINKNQSSPFIYFLQMVGTILIIVGVVALLAISTLDKKEIRKIPNNKIKNYLNTEFASKSNQHNKKIYAFYFSSLHCKPCQEFISVLDQFNNDMQKTSTNFEIIFIELKQNNTLAKSYAHLSFSTLDYKKLKNKVFFDQYKSKQHGPTFVIVNNQGDIIAKHQKGLYKQSFAKVLTKLSTIIQKG
ncbi:MAG: hypothetical protein COA79_24790 [Planctomycetota bacterium]|nr:MAG: hypothetical protein COA79_24790 [Planctomycetota bacterium]